MTVQTVGWVLDHSRSRGFARLVLISLANHANKLGASCHPSLTTIAGEAGVGRATAVRAIEALERDGEIVVQRGGGRGNENHYVLTMGREKSSVADLFDDPERKGKGIGADLSNSSPADQLEAERVRKGSAKGPLSRGRDPFRPSDSIKPQAIEPRERAREALEGVVSAAAPAPVPAQFNLGQEHYDFGAELGIPRDRIEIETRKFVAHHEMHHNRRRDWDAAWRKWICDVPGFDRSSPARSTPGATNGSRAHGAPQTVVDRERGRADAEAFRNGTLGRRGRSQ